MAIHIHIHDAAFTSHRQEALKRGDAEKTPAEREAERQKAINEAIASSNRAGRRIGGKEASAIHGLLKGWRGNGS